MLYHTAVPLDKLFLAKNALSLCASWKFPINVSSLKYTYWLGFIIPLGFPLWKYIEGPKEMPEKALGLITGVVTALYKTTKKWPLSFGVVKILKHFHTIFWSKFFKFYSFILLCSLKQILNESLMCGSLILAPDAAAYKVQTILSPGTFVLRRKRDYKWIVTRSMSWPRRKMKSSLQTYFFLL